MHQPLRSCAVNGVKANDNAVASENIMRFIALSVNFMLKQKSKCETVLHLALMKIAPLRYQDVIEHSLQMLAYQDGLFDWSRG